MSAANLDTETLQSIISIAPTREIVGIVAGVFDNGQRWQGSAGYADLETRSPIATNVQFRIGSITKTFVAVAVLQLVSQELLELDDTIQLYLSDLLPDTLPHITIRQLLDHSSGLADYEMLAGYGDPAVVVRDLQRSWTSNQIVELALREPLAFRPGEGQFYSSTNYVLLGMLIEELTGEPYARLIERGILQPLDMRDTFLPGTDTYIPGPHGRGYITVGAAPPVDVTAWNPSIAGASGEIVSTLADMDAFLAALLEGRLLPWEWLNEMLLPAEGLSLGPGTGYGLGIAILDLPCDVTVYTHGGGVPGYVTGMFASRDGSKRVIACANITFPGQQPVPAISGLVGTVFCAPPAPPSASTS